MRISKWWAFINEIWWIFSKRQNDRNSIFLYIHDVLLYSISNKNKNNISLKKLIDDGDLNKIAIECIENSKSNEIIEEKIIEFNE